MNTQSAIKKSEHAVYYNQGYDDAKRMQEPWWQGGSTNSSTSIHGIEHQEYTVIEWIGEKIAAAGAFIDPSSEFSPGKNTIEFKNSGIGDITVLAKLNPNDMEISSISDNYKGSESKQTHVAINYSNSKGQTVIVRVVTIEQYNQIQSEWKKAREEGKEANEKEEKNEN